MFDLSEKTKRLYLDVQKSMTDKFKGKKVKFKDVSYFSPANKKFYTIVKYYPNEFSYFRCEETIRECKKLMEQNKIKIETVSYEENKFAA